MTSTPRPEGEMTPGPWYISRFEPISGGKDRVVMGGDCFGVAWLMGRSEAENEANARAISALPDLVEALRELEQACERLAATRSQAAYEAMLASGQADDLLALDNARRSARKALSLLSAGGGSSVAESELALRGANTGSAEVGEEQ